MNSLIILISTKTSKVNWTNTTFFVFILSAFFKRTCKNKKKKNDIFKLICYSSPEFHLIQSTLKKLPSKQHYYYFYYYFTINLDVVNDLRWIGCNDNFEPLEGPIITNTLNSIVSVNCQVHSLSLASAWDLCRQCFFVLLVVICLFSEILGISFDSVQWKNRVFPLS